MNSRLFAFFLLVMIFVIWLQPLDFGASKITISKGATAREIAVSLSENHFARDADELLLWLKILGKEKYVKSGTYELKRYKNPLYLIDKLLQGGKSDITITIPEGSTIIEIADILASKGLVDKEHFVRLCRIPSFIAQEGLNLSSLEGYLFPDTYSFASAQSETTIIRVLVANFNRRLEKYHITDSDSLHRTVILASMVEKEAKHAEERPIIAKVFINRLLTKRPLESCATVIYALEGTAEYDKAHHTSLTERDLMVDSPYNTYLHPGLPPGPICSPGESSIAAVIYPASVEYLYFVAKGDGWHHFSKTYKEHLAAKEYYNGNQ